MYWWSEAALRASLRLYVPPDMGLRSYYAIKTVIWAAFQPRD